MQIIATTLIVLGGLLCFANWMSVLQSILTKKFHSAVPFFGAGLLGSGMLLLPATRHWAWLAILLDYGTLAFIIALPHLIRESWNTSQFNLLHDYSGKIENKSVRLCYFVVGFLQYESPFNDLLGKADLPALALSGLGLLQMRS